MDVSNPVGFWNRLGASIIDSIFISLVTGMLTLLFYGHFNYETYTPFDIFVPLYAVILPVIWYGYTVGKRVTGVRIVRVNEEKLGFGTMLMRYLVGGIVYAVTLGIGLIVSAFMVGLREDKRSIHDFIAGTYVTYDPPE